MHTLTVSEGRRGRGAIGGHGEVGGGSAVPPGPHRVHGKRVAQGSTPIVRVREDTVVLMMVLRRVAGSDGRVSRVHGWHLLGLL